MRPDPAPVDGLGAVAVRIEQEAPVVVGAVLRPRARGAVVGIARGDAGLPEPVDLVTWSNTPRLCQSRGVSGCVYVSRVYVPRTLTPAEAARSYGIAERPMETSN